MTVPNALVFVIDDDASVRKGVSRLLRSARYKSEAFESASAFLAREQHPGPACLIVDVRMPGINGMDLQETLIQRRREEQLVFITGHGDISMCAQAMKAEQRLRSADKNKTQHLLDSLTPREFEVMQLVITGMLNKQIAGVLGTAEKTVKVHRGRMMQKLGVTSVAELVRLVEKAGVAPAARHETKVSYSFGERPV